MDVRRLASVTLACLLATARPSAAGNADSTFSDFAALEDAVELGLDPETLAELDALLVEPVDLASGDLGRLRALPWLEEEAIAALAAASPPQDVGELMRLPGWSAELARRIVPFVRFVRRPAGQRAQLALAASDAALAGRFESANASVASRVSTGTTRAPRGFGRLRRGKTTLALGDLTLGHAQGLLVSTGETSAGAGSPIWRSGRGLVGTDALAPSRATRGAGIEWRSARSRVALVAGSANGAQRLLGAVTATLGPGCALQAAALAHGTAAAWSLGAELESSGLRFGVEAAGRERPSLAAAGELRGGRSRCGARIEIVRRSQLPATAGPGARVRERGARTAVIAARTRAAGFDLEAAAAQELRSEPEGGARLRTEAVLGVRTRRFGTGLEARWVWRTTRTDTWHAETVSELERDAERQSWVRFDRLLGDAWRAVLELRAAATTESTTIREGRAWSVRVEREHGTWRPAMACGTFRTDPGISLSAPAPGLRLGSVRVHGDGLHAAAGLRAAAGPGTASAGIAARWTATEPVRIEARWSLAIRLP